MNKLTRMFYITICEIILLFLVSCGGGEQSGAETKEFLVVKGTKVGAMDMAIADKGKKIFTEKCAACHKYNERYVGPPIGDVFKRRSPDYIMSQMLDPDKMIKNNDTVKALFAKYMTTMPNQNLTNEDARAVLEHLRHVAETGGK